jgi:hypothetical protein
VIEFDTQNTRTSSEKTSPFSSQCRDPSSTAAGPEPKSKCLARTSERTLRTRTRLRHHDIGQLRRSAARRSAPTIGPDLRNRPQYTQTLTTCTRPVAWSLYFPSNPQFEATSQAVWLVNYFGCFSVGFLGLAVKLFFGFGLRFLSSLFGKTGFSSSKENQLAP